MTTKKELERALELAVEKIQECPIFNLGQMCPNCLTIGPKNGCYKTIAAHFIKLAKEKL